MPLDRDCAEILDSFWDGLSSLGTAFRHFHDSTSQLRASVSYFTARPQCIDLLVDPADVGEPEHQLYLANARLEFRLIGDDDRIIEAGTFSMSHWWH